MRNYREIKRDIDAIEEDAPPCLQDTVCSCHSCLRYLQLFAELDAWIDKHGYGEPDTNRSPSPEDIARKILDGYDEEHINVAYLNHIRNEIASAIQAERERR